jgi:DNA polymerase III delta subunit
MQTQDIAVFAINNLLIGDIVWMLVIKKLEYEYTIDDVKRMTGLNPWRFTKLRNVESNYSREQLTELLDNLIDLEIKLKSNSVPEIYRIYKAKIISFIK